MIGMYKSDCAYSAKRKYGGDHKTIIDMFFRKTVNQYNDATDANRYKEDNDCG